MWTSPNDNNDINLPSNKKVGAPGGCPTSSLYEQEINSPQSQKLAVGSEVRKKMVIAVKPTSQPITVLIVLKFFIIIIFVGDEDIKKKLNQQPNNVKHFFLIKGIRQRENNFCPIK
jgi:hypothetical protein